ncbi:hypothetical protein PCANC_02473 [Puccinia coronata f. sp. avenae]|uniref:Uncharacterized protein n=1 Tax=Puccinia coronata f. sp. avenae TaxID=200324 RepID=A0A2N5U4K6_9BASI|nr:hypothetical protein PCASD_19256 [Puccinia coronata f. sp. avenae]PLW15144.1 hypothetical protein PCANC_15942 [Puccinia coronata f. sp. avenae]PLW32618.1 hypothetical protein PCASD_13050 [Puccinia coronata f. sp. avenae]PLW57329.1 hypothetical protein PCANC_02473 [Puccinia coronata f. sp. avenae]
MQFSAAIFFLAACSGVFAAPTSTATTHEARIEARQFGGPFGAAANVVGSAANIATLGLFGGGYGGFGGYGGGFPGGFGGYGGW